MKININNSDYEFDIKNEIGRKELIETLCLAYRHKFPFFINLFISLCDVKPVEEKHKNSLAYTKLNAKTERINIYINFNILEEKKFSHEEILFLLFHELLHNYFYHFVRFDEAYKNGHGELVNIVTDYYINEICKELLSDKPINDLTKKKFEPVDYEFVEKTCRFLEIKNLPENYELRKEWTDMNLYEFIIKNAKKQPNFKNDERNFDNHDASFEDEIESNDGKPISEEQAKAIKEIFKNKIQAKEKELEEQLYSSYNKNETFAIERKMQVIKPNYFLNSLKLKRIVSKALSKHCIYNYQRMNRKKIVEDFIFKGRTKINGTKLVVGIDVSGSIGDEELDTFISMLYGLSKKQKNYVFDIIYWSSCDVKKNKTYFEDIKDIREFAKKNPYSSGGTVIETFHEYLNERYKEPIEVINITDGYFSYDKNLNKNILKYHFVLTENAQENFESFYNDRIFDISVIKQIA